MPFWRDIGRKPDGDGPPGDLLVLGGLGLAIALAGVPIPGLVDDAVTKLGWAMTLAGAAASFFRLFAQGLDGKDR